ncbi:acetyltransferase [Actinoplanes sp. OR16]|uniref:GNAT family N-acetyltransferase n=1 Tax=Actinoplanes sp. OR16 TaxID=946334 RepID=UPI000F6D928D|nr:GNAT family N-acetyltransferase [Actinoplanes sp. OR16]BBH69252.1 acetyltransferase [Actinoplanes sp. OR16]
MDGSRLALTTPDTRLRDAWLAAYAEWPDGSHIDASGLRQGDDVRTPAGFAAWAGKLAGCADAEVPLPPGHVTHSSYWWITDRDEVLGAVELRHDIGHPLLVDAGGHIGYSVRPGHRGRGIATWALGATLDRAWARGLDAVLVTCSPENTASARIIEKAGGVLEDVRETPIGPKRRYWISRPR